MPRTSIRIRLGIVFTIMALGLVSCKILSPGTATLSVEMPTIYPARRTQKINSVININTKYSTFTQTLFPTLSYTPTPTGTPYPKDEWISLGPEGGSIRDIVIDPVTPTTMYAVTASAGIFKSISGGKEWKRIHTDRISIHQLLIDPFSPSTLYILSNMGGIYKTTNGGDA